MTGEVARRPEGIRFLSGLILVSEQPERLMGLALRGVVEDEA